MATVWQFSSVQFSRSVLSDSLRPHGLWARQASLSITNSRSLLKFMSIEWVMLSNHLILCHPLLLCLQSFLAWGSFPMSWLFTSGGQSIGASGPSVFPLTIQGWFPSRLTSWISLQIYTKCHIDKQMIGTAPSFSCAVTLGINRVWIHYFQLVFLHTEVFAHKPLIPASSLKVLEACEEHLQNVGAGLPTPSRTGSGSAPPAAPPTAPRYL